jgi:predicted nucleotidyltransferase
MLKHPYAITDIRRLIRPIAERYGVERVALFGSYARGEATVRSDIDLKIEKGEIRSLFQLCGFRLDVEDALKIPVDVITSESLDKEFLREVSQGEVTLYERT